jgi:hypothetical protein
VIKFGTFAAAESDRRRICEEVGSENHDPVAWWPNASLRAARRADGVPDRVSLPESAFPVARSRELLASRTFGLGSAYSDEFERDGTDCGTAVLGSDGDRGVTSCNGWFRMVT